MLPDRQRLGRRGGIKLASPNLDIRRRCGGPRIRGMPRVLDDLTTSFRRACPGYRSRPAECFTWLRTEPSFVCV